MKPLVPPHIERLVPYSAGKPIDEIARNHGVVDVVKLASNENPWGPSPRVVEQMQRSLTNLHRYPDASGYELRVAIGAFHGVSPDEIVLGHGSNELIDLAARVFLDRTDHAVTGTPSFACYRISLTAACVPFTEVPLVDSLYWDIDSLLDATTTETKLLFIANPNNPTGTHVGTEDLRRLLQKLPPDVVVVVDEAYIDFADSPDCQSALTLRHDRERLLVLRTFSKAYGLAALRVGYGVANRSIVDYLNRVRAPFNVGTLAQQAALAALADQDYVKRCVVSNRHEKHRLAAEFEALGFEVAPSQTNFILVRWTKDPARAESLYQSLLEHGIILRHMGAPIQDWLRITIGLPEENNRLISTLRSFFS